MRLTKWLGRHSQKAENRPSLLTIARAALVGDAAEIEEVSRARARARDRQERDAAARAHADAARERRDASARWIEREVRRNGFWFPQDWR
jgi:hypothetical protein